MADYDALIEKSQRFVTLARRIQDAFRKAISELDPLTGLHNRQIMMPELERERQRALRTGTPCPIAIADIDHFKQVNDTHGHAVGDEVTCDNRRPFRFWTAALRRCLPVRRRGVLDLPAEYRQRNGRQGFGAPARPDRKRTYAHRQGRCPAITVSFGLAQIVDDASLKDVMVRADQALYAAKRGGRNQVRLWSGELADRPQGNLHECTAAGAGRLAGRWSIPPHGRRGRSA